MARSEADRERAAAFQRAMLADRKRAVSTAATLVYLAFGEEILRWLLEDGAAVLARGRAEQDRQAEAVARAAGHPSAAAAGGGA